MPDYQDCLLVTASAAVVSGAKPTKPRSDPGSLRTNEFAFEYLAGQSAAGEFGAVNVVPETDWGGIHGNDERVSVAAFKRGVSDHLAIIVAVVYD